MATVIYSVQPVNGHELKPGDDLLVVDLFPPNVRLVMLRYRAVYVHHAFVEGDGAEDIRRRGVLRLKIIEVGQISGWGKAVAYGGA